MKSAPHPRNPGGNFFEVNPTTGTVAVDSPIGVYDGISHNVLAFDQNDVAYTIDRSDDSTSVLQTINMTTGEVIEVYDTGIADISAISIVNTNVVPEPSASTFLVAMTPIGFRRKREIPSGLPRMA